MESFNFVLFITILVFCQAVFSVQDDTKECYYEDLFCESCKSLVRCIKNDDDTWTKEKQGTCSNKCISGNCTDVAEPICDGIAVNVDFPCQSVGIFPHPFYCNHFILCAVADIFGNLKPFVNSCEDGYGFNISTDECDIKLEGNQCKELTYPVPLCEKLGQSGALAERPTLYYKCKEVSSGLFAKVLYPILDRCPHGQIYGDDFTCQD